MKQHEVSRTMFCATTNQNAAAKKSEMSQCKGWNGNDFQGSAKNTHGSSGVVESERLEDALTKYISRYQF